MWNKLLIILLVLVLCGARMEKPFTFTDLSDEKQIQKLNRILIDLQNIINGRLELDLVTTSKADPNDGEFWLIQTGPNVRIQYRGNNHTFTTK